MPLLGERDISKDRRERAVSFSDYTRVQMNAGYSPSNRFQSSRSA